MAVVNFKDTTSSFSSEYLLKLNKVLNLILNDVPDNRDDTIILKLIDSLKNNLNLFKTQLNDADIQQTELESIEKRFALVLFLNDYLMKEVLTNGDENGSTIDFSNSKLNEDKEAEVMAFFFDLLNVLIKSSKVLTNDAEKHVCQDSNESLVAKVKNLNKVLNSFLDALLIFVKSFFDTKFDPTNLQIESSVCCSVFSLVEEMYDFFFYNPNSRFVSLLDTQLFGVDSLHLFLNAEYKSLFVRRSFKRVLQKHIIYLVEQASAQNENSTERLEHLYTRIFQMDISVKIHNLDFFAHIFYYYFFENKLPSAKSFKILYQLKKFHSYIDFTNVKTNFLIDHNFSLDENAMESFAQLLVYDVIFSFINFDEENSNACSTLVISDRLLFFKTFLKYLNNVSVHYSSVQSTQINSKLKRNTDLLFKFHIYFYAILNDWQSGYYTAKTQLLNDTLGIFSFIEKDDSNLGIKTQITLLKYKVIRYMLLPLRMNLKINENQIYEASQIGELIGDLGKEFETISSSIVHIKENYDPDFDSLIDEKNYLMLINQKSFEYKQLLIKQSLINFKIFMRKFNLFSNEFNIFNLISIKQILYILRHLHIEFQLKRLLLQVLNDYFSTFDEYNLYASHFLQEIVASLNLKINESFDENLFKLVGLGLKNLSFIPSSDSVEVINSIKMNLIELINSHLEKCNQNSNQFLEQLDILVNFFRSNLVENKANNIALGFITDILNKSDSYLVKKFNENLLVFENDENEVAQNLKESILIFYESLFDCLSTPIKCKQINSDTIVRAEVSSYEFESLMNEAFLLQIEQMTLSETEAFTRRLLVNFLKSFRLYQFYKTLISSIDTINKTNDDFWNNFNYFGYFLENEFDWQVQLYCLEYFKNVFSHAFVLLDNGKLHNEILFCLANCLKPLIKSIDDFDQQVVYSAVSLLIQLKQNLRLVELLINLDEKSLKQVIRPNHLNTLKANLNAKNIKVSVYSDKNNIEVDQNQVKDFLNKISIDSLKSKLNESNQTSDIYIRYPTMILDDIISSYQFDLDEEKAVDCY